MIVLRNRAFGLLWSSQLLSDVGNWLMVVAVPVYVYELTGSALSTGLAFIAETLPALVMAPFAGVLVDRLDRRLVMVVSDALRAGSVLVMLVVQDRELVWLLYLAIFSENAFAQFFQPAHRALTPSIVGKSDDLDRANGWYSVSGGVVRMVGAPLGGALYSLIGFQGLVLVDCATYVVSALMLMTIPRTSILTDVGDQADEKSARTAFAQLREGAVFVARSPVLRGLLAVSSLFLLANGALNVLLVPYVVSRLGGDSAVVGLMMSALGVGYLISAYVGTRISRGGWIRLGTAYCLIAITGFFAGLFNSPNVPVALVFIALVGVPGGALLQVIRVQLQRGTPDRILGRVSSTFAASEMTATVIGAMIGSMCAGRLGLVTTANSILILVLLAAAIALAWLPADRVAGRGTALGSPPVAQAVPTPTNDD